ncbi:alpha/beta fold hydrolase [Oceanivirga salmonicida]|uniref:alpha/beta fold hydrolase n=1 Tax=Oceanivirga salmonicida TaxID=1769291 RepID=UPI0008328A7F|nr:alpha/beta hydrolase [Oceanivirga salmonicida]
MNYKNPYEHLSGKLNNKKLVNAGFSEKSYDTGDVKLNYVVGPNNGPSLLLIPAQIGMWESYKKVLLALSKNFQVYAIDIRGHGKSSWTPGYYSWEIIGEDIKMFIENVIKQKVIISGNSSGGIIALWCAANIPEYVSGIILEDAPIFSAEMPRFKEKDKFVYNGLKHLVNQIGNIKDRDLANYFKDMEMPVSDKRIKKIPNWFVNWLSRKIKKFQNKYPYIPVEVGFPDSLRLLIKSLSMFDPDFARAFVDGRFYDGIIHEEAFKKTKCPILLIQADWKRYEKYGLVGAFDDDDAKHAISLAPQIIYKKVSANHVIHAFKPKKYIELLLEFEKIVSDGSNYNGK